MRSFLLSSAMVSLAVLSALAGCNNQNPPRPYVDVNWKLRCPPSPMPMDCMAGCTEGVDRSINGYSSDSGVRLSCSVTETATDRFINFTIQNATGQSLAFENVQVPRGGGSALSGNVRLNDTNEFVGAAGGNAPSNGQPCQISAVTFDRDPETGDSHMSGQVLCQTMRAPAANQLCRGLSAAGASATLPAQFSIFACRGLNP
jgi:hypothetical protein